MNEQIEEQIEGQPDYIVNDIINIFKIYPEVFPGGYFRFLKSKITNKIEKNEIIYKNEVVHEENNYVWNVLHNKILIFVSSIQELFF
tara:strand:+ start:119 stop:379 length:261 start_codon:yes stop_codon:yes gene_type:complete